MDDDDDDDDVDGCGVWQCRLGWWPGSGCAVDGTLLNAAAAFGGIDAKGRSVPMLLPLFQKSSRRLRLFRRRLFRLCRFTPLLKFPRLAFVWLRLCLRQWLLRLRRQSLWPWQKERGPFSHHLLQDEKFQPSACLRLLTGQAPQRGTPTMSKRRAQTTVWRTLQITTTTTCSRDMLKPKLKTFAYIICNVIFCGGQNSNDRHHVENCILT